MASSSRSSFETDDLYSVHDATDPARWLSRASSTSSIGTSQSSDASAYSQQSRDSVTSLRSSNRSSRRRRHAVANKRTDKRTSLARSINTFQCTFCTETFTTKHTWQRHEKSLHLPIERWACTPSGPRVTEFDGLLRCAFCSEPSPDDAHFDTHNYAVCRERPLQDRSFNRKDHLTQHLRLVHNVKPEQLGCPLNEWKLPMPAIRSVCGFCGLKMDTWEFRVDHLADHFKTGASMKEWKGDWGFDPSVLFRVEHAIPPYVIGSDHLTVNPFEASAGPSATPRNAYELIKIELDHFVHVYSDKFGGLPTFDKMQLEACRILLSAEVISDGEDADASWLRDLIISNDEILKEAKIRPVRSILEGKLRRLTIPGKDGLFDLCSLESQLHDFVQASPSTSFTDAELQKEACRILRQVEIESNPPAEYVSAFLLDLANSSTAWLIRFRERHKLTRPEIFSSGRSGSLSEINSILQNYSELERTLTDYVELLQAHGIVPDDTALRQKANDIIEQINDPTWKTVALNNEAWLAKFKSRHLPDTSTQPSTALQAPEPHAWGIAPQQPSNSDNANAWMRGSFILNGDCFYRWIARELARWVAMTMSPNNPNQHVPTDEEIQHHARWIVYNDGDPWNQTVADNPVWLQQFKIDVGVLKPSQEDSLISGALFAKHRKKHVDFRLRPKMVIQYQGSQIPLSFATCSIPARIKASLPDKLAAIRKAGFEGVELSMPDILSYGKLLSGTQPKEDDYDAIADVAKQIKSLTDELGLEIMMLQPFANFEGWKKGKFDKKREEAFERARGWMKVMEAAGTKMLQVGSSDSEGISSSFDDLASDLAELADLCATKGFRIAYENWCWATHAPSWKEVWEIVQKANRPNLGLCLDTFQTAGGEYGDPTTNNGLVAASSQEERESRWKKSLEELASTVPADKIYLLQISDAYKMDPPIEDKKDSSGSRPRARWSHDFRPLPCNGGYLPVQDILAAVLKTGFRSWLSVEVFDSLEGENADMEEYTMAAVESVKKLIAIGDE
ncbi:hypothetical protein NM208_g10202 [Fusarium decemcellulare]|uniref:Uncharacterized protein n=1 Tax=Fusarium decemcellulare TaxID=57161 RepID=A0ACC1RYR6_9HYPO|nr:hypothetical protein NM208_g10202 [Fusarium decemcellulare]